ncbi:MAG: M16 family metallopeptidase [Candidatus Aminicenantes bacterium]
MKKGAVVLFFLILVIPALNSSLLSQEKFRKSPPYPDPLPELNLPPIESAFLSNGLGIFVVPRHNPPIITLRLIVLAGESSSPSRFPGTATLTAKMLSRGTLYLSHDELEERIESMGGRFTTSTFPDYSMFTLVFSEKYLDQGLNILSKMVLQPSFSRREIENVKRSMYYELLEKGSDSEFAAKKLLFRILFQEHPYQKSTYSEDVIKNLNQKLISSFYEKYYRPNNARLILTGNLNLSTASRKVSSYLNTWEKKEMKFSFLPPPEPNDQLKICFVDIPRKKDAAIYMGNIMAPLKDDDYFPLLVLDQVLGGTPTSRLFMNLRESKGYAYYAFTDIELFKACGVFMARAKVRPEVVYDSVMEILNETKKIIEKKIPSLEIEQAKSYLIGNFPLQVETMDDLSLKAAQIQAFQLGEEHWNKYYENIMLIDSNKVYEIAQKYPFLTPVVVIAGDKNIIVDHLREFDKVEIYNHKGVLQYSIQKEISHENR